MSLIALAARSKNNVIGLNGTLPFHSKEDFKFFRYMTMGQNICVGSETAKKLPFLKDRNVYIITKSVEDTQIFYTDINRGIKIFKCSPDKLPLNPIICGGAKIYESFLPICNELYLTEFDLEYEGDTFMPKFEHLFSNKEIFHRIPEGLIWKYTK